MHSCERAILRLLRDLVRKLGICDGTVFEIEIDDDGTIIARNLDTNRVARLRIQRECVSLLKNVLALGPVLPLLCAKPRKHFKSKCC